MKSWKSWKSSRIFNGDSACHFIFPKNVIKRINFVIKKYFIKKVPQPAAAAAGGGAATPQSGTQLREIRFLCSYW
jgi:hypothetical protein